MLLETFAELSDRDRTGGGMNDPFEWIAEYDT